MKMHDVVDKNRKSFAGRILRGLLFCFDSIGCLALTLSRIERLLYLHTLQQQHKERLLSITACCLRKPDTFIVLAEIVRPFYRELVLHQNVMAQLLHDQMHERATATHHETS